MWMELDDEIAFPMGVAEGLAASSRGAAREPDASRS
jgi:hypothetical protein